jgi:hypothetical protein
MREGEYEGGKREREKKRGRGRGWRDRGTDKERREDEKEGSDPTCSLLCNARTPRSANERDCLFDNMRHCVCVMLSVLALYGCRKYA